VNEFQLFLYLSQRIPARSAVELSARSALTKGSIRDSFCSHFLEGAVRHSAMQGVHRPGKSLRVANLSEVLKTVAARSAQSRETSTLRRR
jgi:hypothetical protein